MHAGLLEQCFSSPDPVFVLLCRPCHGLLSFTYCHVDHAMDYSVLHTAMWTMPWTAQFYIPPCGPCHGLLSFMYCHVDHAMDCSVLYTAMWTHGINQ